MTGYTRRIPSGAMKNIEISEYVGAVLFDSEYHHHRWQSLPENLKRQGQNRSVSGFIMHSGILDNEDIERIGSCIRDWVKQMGA